MSSIPELQDRIQVALEDARAKANTAIRPVIQAATARVRVLQAELSDAICVGAVVCPRCRQPPHGMIQDVSIKHVHYQGYEIGCSGCGRTSDFNPAAFGITREDAVAAWNAGPSRWMPPKPRDEQGRPLQPGSQGTGE